MTEQNDVKIQFFVDGKEIDFWNPPGSEGIITVFRNGQPLGLKRKMSKSMGDSLIELGDAWEVFKDAFFNAISPVLDWIKDHINL